MNRFKIMAVAAALSPLVATGAAHAQATSAPITFAQVTDINTGNGLSFVNDGNGNGLLNTDVSSGDMVNFSYENIVGVTPALSGTLSAIELINNGAGVSTTSLATQSTDGQYTDSQNFNSAFKISYLLAGAATGANNLLTLTITPITAAQTGYLISGQDEGSGGSSSTSNTGRASLAYTETFTSDFLKFQTGSTITAGFSFSAVVPSFTIGADGLLNSFTYDQTGTFSSNPPPAFVPEPGSLAFVGFGLVGLTVLFRRRQFI